MIKHLFTLNESLGLENLEDVSVYYEPAGSRMIITKSIIPSRDEPRIERVAHGNLVHLVYQFLPKVGTYFTYCLVCHTVLRTDLSFDQINPNTKFDVIPLANAYLYGGLYITCFGKMKSEINKRTLNPIHVFWNTTFSVNPNRNKELFSILMRQVSIHESIASIKAHLNLVYSVSGTKIFKASFQTSFQVQKNRNP